MTCSNCGAEYDNTFDKCPYCGETFKIPGSGDKPKGPKNYNKYTIKFARLINVKDEVADKIVKILPYAGAVILGLLLVYGAYTYFTGAGSKEYKTKKQNIDILDEFYEDKDYDGIFEKIDSMGEEAKNVTYSKYYSIYLIYEKADKFYKEATLITDLRDAKVKDREAIAENAEITITNFISITSQINKLIALHKSDNDVKEAIYEYRDVLITEFSTKYLLSKEEVTEIMSINAEDKEAISAYADVVFRRMDDTGNGYIEDECCEDEHDEE